ncbi:helix-turn-helix domain-containing protein [Haloechinothrix halophila]|uniref:helix-turn-helix domain-containing protein n=1 Tax=Haloechinothrix halophila TaxID=1069073 RepID=UPI0004034C1D|nr:helix-turn-helix domain-containing protein [Haloechinothrix halophila]
MSDLDKLDDPAYPAFTIGQAAALLGVQQAFLRNLDNADIVKPERSEGGHRRYSRRQLETVARMRDLLDQGHTIAAASRILGLENELAAAHEEIDDLREQLEQSDDDDAAM